MHSVRRRQPPIEPAIAPMSTPSDTVPARMPLSPGGAGGDGGGDEGTGAAGAAGTVRAPNDRADGTGRTANDRADGAGRAATAPAALHRRQGDGGRGEDCGAHDACH